MKQFFAVCLLVVFAGFIVYFAAGSVNSALSAPWSGSSTTQAEGSPLPGPHAGTALGSGVLRAEGSPLPGPHAGTPLESGVLRAEGSPLPGPHAQTSFGS